MQKYSVFSLVKNAFTNHENWEVAWKDPEPKKEYDVIIARKLLHTPKYSRDARALMVTLQLIARTAKNAIAYLQRGTPEV